MASKRVSGNTEEHYSYCNDARVINVYGGVQPANFVPNANFQQRCGANKRSVDTEKVLEKAVDAIVADIKKLEPIASKL